jgi:hypothetical protein
MSSEALYRWGGLALVLGVVFGGIGSVSFIFHLQSLTLPWLILTLVWNFGALLLLMGLPGLYARQAPHAGVLGFVGFILTFIGWFLYSSYFLVTTLLFLPWLAQVAPNLAAACSVMRGCSFANGPPAFFIIFFVVAGLTFALGGILLGIAIIRARILPRWTGWLLLLGIVLIPVLFFPLNGIISLIINALVSGLPYLVFLLPAFALMWIGYALMSKRSGRAIQPPPASP